MRLIDADKLILNLNDWAFSEAPDERHEGTERLIRQTRYDTIQECMRTVEEQPSAQKKGKWRDNEDYNLDIYWTCSVCGADFDLIEGKPEDNDYNYCPNCGADMRGETE